MGFNSAFKGLKASLHSCITNQSINPSITEGKNKEPSLILVISLTAENVFQWTLL